MKIVCTNIDDRCINISVGTEYDATENEYSYNIKNDVGTYSVYNKRYFEPVLEGEEVPVPKRDEIVDRTGHYLGNTEPFDVYKSMGIFPEVCKANILKYTMRQGKKVGEELNDIKKIIDYAVALAVWEGVDPEEIKGLVNNRVDHEVIRNAK